MQPDISALNAPQPGTLSICMIVKNEADLLDRCLKSIKNAADQVIVVDTGSTDSTVAIAKENGAEVVQVQWRNDFAWARNISLQNATGAWILWLDADDVVPPESIPQLIDLKKKAADRVYGLVVRNEKPDGTGTEFVQARMFPNRSDIQFERRIHEQMMPSALRSGLTMEKTSIVVEHHGYADPETLRKKASRNVELMLQDYDKKNPDPVTAVEIADSYFLTDNLEKAKEWYQSVLDIKEICRQMPSIAGQAYLGLGNVANKKKYFADAVRFFTEASKISPWRPDILYNMAVAQELGGNSDIAIFTLQKIIELKPAPGQVGVDFRSSSLKATLRLVRLLVESKKLDGAYTVALSALQVYPTRPEIHNMSGRIDLLKGKLIDALHRFEQSLSIRPEGNIDAYIGLCLIYKRAGKQERALETIHNVQQIFSSYNRFKAFQILFENAQGTSDDASIIEEMQLLKREYPDYL